MANRTYVKLELDGVDSILSKRNLNKVGGRMFASEVKRQCDPYVPALSNTLKNTAVVMDDGVLYGQPYAASQYYKNSGNGSEGLFNGGQRGKNWDKRMMADRGKDLTNFAAKITGGVPK